MNFTIINRWRDYPKDAKNHVFLVWDNWNDFGYFTHFGVFYVDGDSVSHDLEAIKIGFLGQQEKERVFQIGHEFTNIGADYFSVGVSEEFYERLNAFPQFKDEILESLNDIAYNEELYESVVDEPVVQNSFFRFISPSTVTGQFRRMAHGGVKLTPFSFTFSREGSVDKTSSIRLFFDVFPDSSPPTNIHVLIGRNGVGKTFLINEMINSLVKSGNDQPPTGTFEFHKNLEMEEVERFANLISISFSAFDKIAPIPNGANENGINFSYIGLMETSATSISTPTLKGPTQFAKEFLSSLRACKSRGMKERWTSAVRNLFSNPNTQIQEVELLIDEEADEYIKTSFGSLSSGHKIVLLTITKLIEQLQEKSLVIMDEPEAHLHPPLLSAYIRTISELLITTNGVAIVATHSPVVLQEVPRSCIWKLRRSNNFMVAERLQRESFGENVGILTNEIFKLEVRDSGFYKMIHEGIKNHDVDYQTVIESFNNQLGSEARLVTMATLQNKNERP